MEAETLIRSVAEWAQHDKRVMAAGVCGSYARGMSRPDSDLDLCLVCHDSESLLADHAWPSKLAAGARIVGPAEDYGLMQSLRVYYGALEVEFGIAPEAWVELPIDSGTAQVMKDGFRIVYDPEGRLRKALDCAQGVSWSGRGEHESGNHHRA